jgi:hypothetical protein
MQTYLYITGWQNTWSCWVHPLSSLGKNSMGSLCSKKQARLALAVSWRIWNVPTVRSELFRHQDSPGGYYYDSNLNDYSKLKFYSTGFKVLPGHLHPLAEEMLQALRCGHLLWRHSAVLKPHLSRAHLFKGERLRTIMHGTWCALVVVYFWVPKDCGFAGNGYGLFQWKAKERKKLQTVQIKGVSKQ